MEHPRFGEGIIVGNEDPDVYDIYFRRDSEEREISKNFDGLVVVKLAETDPDAVSLEDVKSILTDLIEPLTSPVEFVELGDRWEGGKLILEPGREGLQSKDMPIETFFHKIVMTRDRLRVMEQKINSSNLPESEKLELQQYLTRIYGSLTSFNVLFARKEDQFKGIGS